MTQSNTNTFATAATYIPPSEENDYEHILRVQLPGIAEGERGVKFDFQVSAFMTPERAQAFGRMKGAILEIRGDIDNTATYDLRTAKPVFLH